MILRSGGRLLGAPLSLCAALSALGLIAVWALPSSPAKAAEPAVLNAGTGFFIRHDGTLLTAAHVAQNCRRIEAELGRNPPIAASLIAADAVADVAILRVPAMVPAAFGLAAGVDPDTALRVLGDPLGGAPMIAHPVLINADIRPGRPADTRSILWLRDRRIGHGWSGGPVLNEAGQVVGLIVAILPHAKDTVPVLNHPQDGVAMASGAAAITEVLRRAGIAPEDTDGAAHETAPDAAQSAGAVARILCWH